MILEMTRPVQGGLRQERKLEAVSNNLANVDTTGYKKDVISFDRKFKAQLNKDYSQGDVVETGNPFDIALGRPGFFKVETEDGIQYTRNGSFTLNSEGVLVDMSGNPVLGQGGAIVIGDATTAQINLAGEIRANGEVVDTLDVVNFQDPDKLEKIGENLMAYTGNPGEELAVENPVIKQMTLEKSNVRAVDEMVKMIDHHRMFETFTKSMMTFDEVDNMVITKVGVPR
jgi:flagellar basal-body rod protein FlgG